MDELYKLLKERFDANMIRHEGVKWDDIMVRITDNSKVLTALKAMESTSGEPDVVVFKSNPSDLYFVDCSKESPAGRRSLCYDREALEKRKNNKPDGNAIDAADEMGIRILTDTEYRYLQTLGTFDTKTSSWVLTPEPIRKLGGAIFCDRRYDHVFTYHNGADSYYSARGFRGCLKL